MNRSLAAARAAPAPAANTMATLALAALGVAALGLAMSPLTAAAQTIPDIDEPYAVSAEHPFGQLNPEAPANLSEYAFMIGHFECALLDREFRDGEWVTAREGRATWRASWIMNGWAILDEFRDEWGSTNVNVRVYSTDDDLWRVHWTAVTPTTGEIFEARRVEERMVMDFERETEGGFAYTQRFAFTDIRTDAYRWTNEIIYPGGTAVEIGWIECRRATASP